jgi:predicted DNA-binding WGR domain protein
LDAFSCSREGLGASPADYKFFASASSGFRAENVASAQHHAPKAIAFDAIVFAIKRHLVLRRIGPGQDIRRFYSLMIERDLFGVVRLVHNWGRTCTRGQEKAEEFGSEDEAGKALETLAQAMRRQGYQDL